MKTDNQLRYHPFEKDIDATLAASDPVPIRTEVGEDAVRGVGYQFDVSLKYAISAALTLGRPLLVTGEPGSGKTELGYAIARNLPDRPMVRHFVCRSASEVKDLFYTYDALARFNAAQAGEAVARGPRARPGDSAAPYIRYAALGHAVLDAWGVSGVTDFPVGQPRSKASRSVVIIDEIDKASRDFCNDLLDQLESLSFEVPELAREMKIPRTPSADSLPRSLRPIVIIASNSEKLLPEPFLRRCVYHPIASPSDAMLDVIVHERLLREFGGVGDGRANQTVKDVRDFFTRLRGARLAKMPGTAELIDATVVAFAHASREGWKPENLMDIVLPTLIKDVNDMDVARRMVSSASVAKG